MKIRTGFVSNSSSASFAIPSILLTDEQKEMLLSIDDMKEEKAGLQEKFGDDHNWETSKNDYPVNEEYHRIYQKMLDDNRWDDSWSIGEHKEDQLVSGSTMMENGSLRVLMEHIGIDIEIVEAHEQLSTRLATHPEAVKYFIELNKKYRKKFEDLDKKQQEIQSEFLGGAPLERGPYEMSDKELEENELPYYRRGKDEN
ncbi:MAG: hypothetical protein ACTSSP_00260 [Candidatus Asgardarchaeia archaeon]